MNKVFMTCLDNIIELEKTSIIQDRTMESLQNKISMMGKRTKIDKPEMPAVQYQAEDESFDSDLTVRVAGIFAVLGAVIAFFISYDDAAGQFFIWRIFHSALTAVVWLFISGAAGLILGAIFSVIKMIYASAANKKSQKNAEEEANRLYGEDVLRYNNELAADAKRVSDELQQKAVLEDTCRQLKEKHEGTLRTLTKFYDAADIYIIYRNIIAMCLIAEYLKSGICTELTGPHGAFIVCKYEMYEKRKIEQLDKLDKIISQLDQLHFDNQMLDASLKQINSHVSELVDVVDEVKHIQIDNAQKNEQMMTNLSNQIGSYGDKILSQNSVIAYNTECSANELNQIKWLEYYKTFLK